MLEYYAASLNGRQKEHNLRNWRDVVPEWFEQNIQMDFNDRKHLLNAFSKYLVNYGKPPPNGKNHHGPVKLTAEELKSL
jgi:hypothetical protein